MATSRQHLYLVDGSAYIFRAYHRLPPLTNPQGVPVGAVYGYTTMLWKLADDLHKADGPTHLAVVLDKAGTSFRNAMYDQYKANRPPAPEDLVPQFPLIRDATRAFSLPCIEEPDLEADDMIASYARAAAARGWDVTIVSSDKDLMQLVGRTDAGTGGDAATIDMLDTMKNQRIDVPEVIEKFGVPPEKVGDVLALMGDSVDNVPGIRGIGPKTATKLIQEHGDLESVLAAAPGMKPGKLRDSLIEQADMARLSRRLVALKEDCSLPLPLEAFELTAIPPDPLAEFLTTHGFASLLRRLGVGAGSPLRATELNPAKPVTAGAQPVQGGSRQPLPEMPAIDRSAYECVQTLEALDRWIARGFAARLVAVDTETSMLDSMRAELVGVSLAVGPNAACYIPLGHGGSDMFAEKPPQIDKALALARLKPLLESDAVLKIGQNIKYDLNVLARHGVDVAPIDDTMVLSFDLDAGRDEDMGGHGMDQLAQRHLGHATLTFKDVCGTGKKAIPFGEVPVDRATQYAAEDADVTWRLHALLKPRLSEEHATRIYERVDRPLITVVAGMERHGIHVDRERLAGLSSEFATQLAALEGEIHALAGAPFTIASPKQLGEVLFDQLGLKGGKKGKTGQYSTDQSVLEGLAGAPDGGTGAELARKVLDWRQLAKLRSTYTEALQAAINPDTRRVHTSYSLVGAQTGRLSSTEPNLQNIPIRTEIGRQIRDCFVAEPGHVLLAADYSQIELRLAAHMADVPALKAAFAEGQDIHARTAQELFGQVDRDTRGRAKTINFAILYGISRWGLATRLGTSADEAQAMIDRYFERFPGIQRYIHETLEAVRERGYSLTLFGRKCWFPRINSKNQAERQGSERAAINAPIQGTCADIIKRAMARMGPALTAAGLTGTRMLLQVHDELVFEVPHAEVEAAGPVIRAVMAGAALPAVQLDVPLGIEIGSGPSWGVAH